MRRLPGPAVDRLSDGGNSRGSLRIVSGLAENTNSIFCDGSSEPRDSKWMSGSAESRNHQPRGKRAQRESLIRSNCALSRARPGDLCFSLDKDLHGCRSLSVVILRLRNMTALDATGLPGQFRPGSIEGSCCFRAD